MEHEIYESIRVVRDRHVERFWADPNVTGFGIGLLSRPRSLSCGIIVTVKDRGAVRYTPAELDGVPLEIREQAFAPLEFASMPDAEAEAAAPGPLLAASRGEVVNPMIGGISIGPKTVLAGGAGTLGLVVNAAVSQSLLLLSNAHVLCGNTPAAGDLVYQPAKAQSVKNYQAGTLIRWYIGNVAHNGTQYGMDAAVAMPDPDRTAPTAKQIYIGPDSVVDVQGTATVALNDAVWKSGLITNVTKGTVVAVDFDARNDTMDLKRQFLCESPKGADFADSGDSGSVVVSNGRVVGLLWGSTTRIDQGAQVGVVSPIAPVMQKLAFRI